MKVAIVHEWFSEYAGSEKVTEQIIELFPDADLYALVDVLKPETRAFLKHKHVTTSFIQKLPFSTRKFRNYFPLMPFAIEQLDLSGYDLIISSSHAFAKGVITGPDQLHICYCHSPIRYAWDFQNQYLRDAGLNTGIRGLILRWFLHKIRIWDVRTANGVDLFIANSSYIRRRIRKVYGRSSKVIHPGVSIEKFSVGVEKEDYFLTASRLVPYKRVDIIVEAFVRMPEKKLKVIGDGPGMSNIKHMARKSPNIEILGYQDFSTLRHNMQRAKAFIFAAEEDFGIIPVEAQACGTPVLAYGKGGVKDSVIDGVTGLFFENQTAQSICDVVSEFDDGSRAFDSNTIRSHAKLFSNERFREEFMHAVYEIMSEKEGLL
ncbi:glycosyltransferase family 4 protein [Gynuella sp.]|uniref:glycosyltransferase family 4 protein n=1 Tax=Gynuella sp. TaxID=2969146 RepID=UPI003D0F01B1